ncbi:NUDIX hydrolase [Fervidibacillus halotolerans]|uniref:CoA pyrophosphatase n=1 Tax=Fervidibacillus halotolerans TaxID=2980027 RepID=A0A9E8M2G1_9BACI|nr:CoA pyrophosphatase [Fervidibacillus halotolerans]WAA13331.1 CoA pyrophosphatase [Fervidibacillus halotolerans]
MKMDQIIGKLENRRASLLHHDTFRQYGILVPITKKDEELHILFEVRSHKLRQQPGEICFPGGKVEKEDKHPEEAARRETTEELGIPFDRIGRVFPLDYMIQPIEGRIIYPFVGFISIDKGIKPNEQEVEEIFTVPIRHLLEMNPDTFTVDFNPVPEERFPFHLIPGGKNYPWQKRTIKEHFFYYEDYVIWGLTANILQNFLSIIREDG